MLILVFLLVTSSGILIYMAYFSTPKISAKHIEELQPGGRRQRVTLSKHLANIFPTKIILEKLRLEAKIRMKLEAAHIKLTAQAFFNLKLLLIIFLLVFAFMAFNRIDPLILSVSLLLGYIGPDIWLKAKINTRKDIIVRVLPETVDLLGLCVEGGLDFTTAIKWILEKKITNNPLLEELTFVTEEIKWGKSRAQALKDMSKRLNVPEISSFVQTLVQAERMGTPVAEAFTILSEDTRLMRFNRGERFASKAPIKILIPLVFCILPVIAIVIGGPILLQFISGGITAGFNP